MLVLNFHSQAWASFEGCETKLRAACTVHLNRLRTGQRAGLRIEKATDKLWELKVSWNKQEFRFLFFYGHQSANITHFFQKKSRKLKAADTDLATGRMKEMQIEQASTVRPTLH